jgi:hypothetical protein
VIAAEEDGGMLWGKPLYGPMILVDRQMRFFVRNDGASGTLPRRLVLHACWHHPDGAEPRDGDYRVTCE